MLKTLYIKDYALVDELRVEFKTGLNIITGETGAGKSIIVGAMGVILGGRYDKDIIRGNASKAILEGEFQITGLPELEQFFLDNDLENDGSVILIRREINDTGRSRNFINDSPVSLPILEQLGNLLVDLHGQHEHQLLLQASRHIDYLDDFAGLGEQVRQVRTLYQNYIDTARQLKELLARKQEAVQQTEIYEFQLNEISKVNPQPNEDEELKKEELIARNAEILFESTQLLFDQLYESDGSVSEIIKKAISKLQDLEKIDDKFTEIRNECENAAILIDEAAASVSDYNHKINFDSDRLEEIRNRLAQLTGLLKKYGGSIHTLLQHKQDLQAKLLHIENIDEDINALQNQLQTRLETLKQQSLALSGQRVQAAEQLAKSVMQELAGLGMANARFHVAVERREITEGNFLHIEGKRIQVTPKGIDNIEFLISANPGEELKPLVTVASGGEISRIMLALKSLLAKADRVPVLIFDEIDIGISGRIALVVGKSLQKLAASRQIICITHLPQIASSGHYQYLVEKVSNNNTTLTTIRELAMQERIEQIARLIGGEAITDTHLMSAAELIKEVSASAN
ncbi:MAG TPA: DNA repair protein RecN [bacterium]|nr:DNA repair protein RecN [bacterium]HPN42405.1 DNA repair protein RecN [bacterium]